MLEETIHFLLIAVLVDITPGPAVLFILTKQSLGLKYVVASIFGLMTANIIWMSLVVVGLASLLVQFPSIFKTLQVIGALYLLYLASRIIRHGIVTEDDNKTTTLKQLNKHYLQGAFVSLSNPKALLFFMALFPNFISLDHSLSDAFYFGVLKLMSLFCVMLLYGMLGKQVFNYLEKYNALHYVYNGLGVAMVIAAITLLIV